MTGACEFDAIVIGGGSAGLAASIALVEGGVSRVLVVERDNALGGVLRQCVHDGFGLHVYGTSLTGPEYAQRWVDMVNASPVRIACETTVLATRSLSKDDEAAGFEVDAIGAALGGHVKLRTKALICATGCRERTRGSLRIPGGRPAGIFSAGEAQYMVNVANQMPGTKIAILGSGDIGLIMARRLTLEGAEVKLVLGQEATGLLRNHVNCIQDFDIPIRYGWGLVSIHGFGQLQGITVAPLDGNGEFDLSRREYMRVNALLLAVGLVPEREVLAGVSDDAPGLFICGNARKPHDLVDQVTCEAIRIGLEAAAYVHESCGGDRSSAGSAVSQDLRRLAALVVDEPKGRMADIAPVEDGSVKLACTVCPNGCVLTVRECGDVEGSGCSRGFDFAAEELSAPKRVFTGTVAVAGGGLVSVRTDRAVLRSELFDVARACRSMVARTPVRCGTVLCKDVVGTGASLVATADFGVIGGEELL